MGTIQIDGSTPKITVGNATAEDATILFDGNAQDFYIALDDSADDLLIGKGSTVGTTPAIAIDENLKVNIPVTTASTSASTGSLTTGGGAGIGADLYVGDDVYLITDSAVLGFGADKDTLLTHTDGTGLTLNSTNKLCFNDASQFVQGSSATVLSIGATDEIDLTATAVDLNGTFDVSGATTTAAITASGIIKTDATTAATSTTDGSLQTDGGLSVALDGVIGDDLLMLSDASVIHFGADSEVTLTHSADVGLNLKHTATADDKPIILTLQTGETDMAANDVIGKIAFQAPDEGTGTDAILVSAAIQAVAEGDHSSSSNATRLEFMTGASEAATQKLQITSDGRGLSSFTAAAWVYYSQTANAILGSHNVSSVTDTSAGDHTVNFDTDMNNDDYAIGQSNNVSSSFLDVSTNTHQFTVGSFQGQHRENNNLLDTTYNNYVVFANI